MAIKIGDVFAVGLDSKQKKYFQYVANDITQLNSEVIRCFSKSYSLEESPDIAEILADKVDFYAHVVIKWGIKFKLWEKFGNSADIGSLDIFFRCSNDYGAKPDEQIATSNNWYVWRVGEKSKYVGILEGNNKDYEMGVIVNPYDVLERMKNGSYSFVYPK